MKKVISIFLIFLLSSGAALNVFSLDFSVEGISAVVDKIYELPEDKLEAFYVAGSPLLITDEGVDALIGLIKDYGKDGGSGMFDGFVETALNYADADTLIRSLESVKCISPKIRQKYVSVLDENTELTLTADEKETVDAFLSKVYSKVTNLKPLLRRFELSDAAVVNLLGIFGELNEKAPLELKNGLFDVNYVNSSLQASFDEVWKGTGHSIDLSKIFSSLAQLLNSSLDTDEAEEIAGVFEKINFAEIQDKESTSQSGGSSGGGAGSVGTAPGITEVTQNKILKSFDAESENYILCKIENGEKVPVKLSFYSNGKIYAVCEENAVYEMQKCANTPFTDNSGWGKKYIEALYFRNIVNGKTDTLFMPDEKITREEFVKLIIEMLDLTDNSAENVFDDVVKNSWYEKYVASAYKNGIVSGISAAEFGVGNNIKRQDMAKIINTILENRGIKGEATPEGINDFDSIADYAKDSVAKIKGFGIISGDENGNFNPEDFATRQEAAKMIYGLIEVAVNNFNK